MPRFFRRVQLAQPLLAVVPADLLDRQPVSPKKLGSALRPLTCSCGAHGVTRPPLEPKAKCANIVCLDLDRLCRSIFRNSLGRLQLAPYMVSQCAGAVLASGLLRFSFSGKQDLGNDRTRWMRERRRMLRKESGHRLTFPSYDYEQEQADNSHSVHRQFVSQPFGRRNSSGGRRSVSRRAKRGFKTCRLCASIGDQGDGGNRD